MKFPTYKEMGERIAEQALDEYVINGKTLREWIKLLSEQEPCDDVVSRAYIEPIIEELENICVNADEHILNLLADIRNAPSVRPQEQTGHWIKSRDSYGNYHFVCSECGNDIATQYADTWEDKYCSECGAKMA